MTDRIGAVGTERKRSKKNIGDETLRFVPYLYVCPLNLNISYKSFYCITILSSMYCKTYCPLSESVGLTHKKSLFCNAKQAPLQDETDRFASC